MPEGSEFPVAKYRFVPSDAMPESDIQIDDRKNLSAAAACSSVSRGASGARVDAVHPKSQPRPTAEGGVIPISLPRKPAKILPLTKSNADLWQVDEGSNP